MKTITVQELRQNPDAVLIDVRTPAEYEAAHIAGATLFPLTGLDAARVQEFAAGKPVVVVCRSGGRAREACGKLSRAGLADAAVLEGGLSAWQSAGFPVTLGRQTISLERQVRIAAGSIVFIGALLGYFVNPAWIGLAAFVGAGLVFSGVTDTCGMAMVLARMPWNNAKPASCESKPAEPKTT